MEDFIDVGQSHFCGPLLLLLMLLLLLHLLLLVVGTAITIVVVHSITCSSMIPSW
jgi:hypothetical protein